MLWGVRHRVSSAYFPQSNGRAKVAGKTANRLLWSKTGPTGCLDQDHFVRAILQLHNSPDPDCSLSPAQIIFSQPLLDSLSFINRTGAIHKPLCASHLATSMECQRHSPMLTHQPYHGIITSSPETPSAASPWRHNIHTESTRK